MLLYNYLINLNDVKNRHTVFLSTVSYFTNTATKNKYESPVTIIIIHVIAFSMDHSPIKQTFELGKFISTAGTKCGNAFSRVIQKYTKFTNFT